MLKEATELVGLKTRLIEAAEFEELRNLFEAVDTSYLRRLMGFFSLINIMWFAAIIGIACFSMPVIYVVAKQLAPIFGGYFYWLAKGVRKFIIDVLWPLLMKMHYYGVLEVLHYYIVFCVLVMSHDMDPNNFSTTMVAFSSYVFLLSAVFNTFHMHFEKSKYNYTEDLQFWYSFVFNFLFLASFPTVHRLDSLILGALTMFCLYVSLMASNMVVSIASDTTRSFDEFLYRFRVSSTIFFVVDIGSRLFGSHIYELLATKELLLGSPLLEVNLQTFKFGLVFFGVFELCLFRSFELADALFGDNRKGLFHESVERKVMYALGLLGITGALGYGMQIQGLKNITTLYLIGIVQCTIYV